jgi:hypothetical protein
MAKNAARSPSVPPAQPPKPPRGRPPQPGGSKPQAEIQRAYRARLAAAGKVVTIVDRDVLADQTMFESLRERLQAALSKLELQDQQMARLTARNTHIENELKRVEQHNLNLLKDNIVLKQAAAPTVRARRRAKTPAT